MNYNSHNMMGGLGTMKRQLGPQITQTINRAPPPPKKRNIDQETLNELKQAFNLFDSQQVGEIDARELKAIMRAFGIFVKKQDIKNIFREMNKDINETINFNEFVGIMSYRLVPNNSKL